MTYTKQLLTPATFFCVLSVLSAFATPAHAIDLDEAFVEASHELGFFGEGTTTDGSSLWVMDTGTTLYRYDISSGGFVFTGTVTTETGSKGLAWDGTSLWLGSGTDTNTKVDPTTGGTVGSVTTLTPTGSSGGLTFDGHYLWKATRPAFNQFDPDTGEVLRTIGGFDLPGIEEGLAFDGRYLYTITYDDDFDIPPVIWKIDAQCGTVASDSFPLPPGKYNGLTFDGESLWAVGSTTETIYKISSTTKQVRVQIDIKPNSCQRMNSRGVVPVVILGSETFDVTNIDVSTLSLGGTGVNSRGNGAPMCSLQNANQDGYWDLMCQFNAGDGGATVTGILFDGTSDGTRFEGIEPIRIAPKGRRHRSEEKPYRAGNSLVRTGSEPHHRRHRRSR
jgi:glutamine cyclotransferase